MSVPSDMAQVIARGQALYEQQIRAQVESRHNGKILVLDVNTGNYEVDADTIMALDRARAKQADAALYVVRVGSPTAVKLGGRFKVEQS